jgi:hypothetical protein
VLVPISVRNCCQYSCGTSAIVATAQTNSVSSAAGSRRRARRAQNCHSDSVPVLSTSRTRCAVMRNPEIAKNTSTPTKPPGITSGQTW